MAEGRVQKRQILTRASLLAAAHRLMSEQGVDETTIQQITNAANVGFGTFYSYFASKDEIAGKVLDCVIHNLGLRNRKANIDAGVTDPVLVIANSVRLTAAEMRRDPMWRWWLKRTDLMVRHMNAGFRPFGIKDMEAAQSAGLLHLPDGNIEAGWGYLIWLLAGTITDIVEGVSPSSCEITMAEAVMRVMGVTSDHAILTAHAPLPPYPAIPVDFKFMLEATK
jgi:AcrR family transcriptional regulator